MKISDLQDADSAVWADYFVEPHSGDLYRQDARGRWYDVEGVRLSVPIFLRGDTLVSLPGKVARASFAFRDQPLFVSPNLKLIAVGKMVVDEQLRPVRYFGERLAGLGPGHVDLGPGDVWQEVLLGLNRRGFINEFTHQPLVLNNEEVGAHAGAVQKDGVRYDTWKTRQRSYVTAGATTELVSVAGAPAELDFSTYVRLRELELVRAKVNGRYFYIDLDERTPFRLAALGEAVIVKLDRESIPGRDLFDVETADDSYVFDAQTRDVFLLDDGAVRPATIEIHPIFPNDFYVATVSGEKVLCDQKTQTVLRLGPERIRIGEVRGKPGDRLLEATTVGGEPVVLDAADGMDHLQLAITAGQRLVSINGSPKTLGALTVQAVTALRVGGPVERLVVLTDAALPLFTLPADLMAYNDQPVTSIFAGNPIVSVDFAAVTEVKGSRWHPAIFLSFSGSEEPTLINAGSGRPLHLEGEGHRNELVTEFDRALLGEPHFLGEHRMVGVKTLTENHRRGELLFSANTGRSWLPFYDGYLPIFRRIVRPTADELQWEYELYEIRESAGVGEYVVVEKAAPHRILALEDNLRYVPRIISRKDRAVINPEQATQVKKLFLSGAALVEVI